MGDNLFQSLMQLLLAFGVVFGGLFALRYYLLRHASRAGLVPRTAPLLRLRDRLPLSPKTAAYIIQAGDECFLVCSSEQGIAIRPLTSVEGVEDTEQTVPETPFALHLRTAFVQLRKGRRE